MKPIVIKRDHSKRDADAPILSPIDKCLRILFPSIVVGLLAYTLYKLTIISYSDELKNLALWS